MRPTNRATLNSATSTLPIVSVRRRERHSAPGGDHADDDAGGYEADAQPRQGAEQESTGTRGASPVGVQPQGEQRGAGEHRAGGQLGIDGGAVGQQRRAEADRGRGTERPRVGAALRASA